MTSPLDRDLAAALSNDPPATTLGAGRSTAAPQKGNVRLLLVLLVMAVGIVTLVMTSFQGAAVYAKTVDQLAASRGELAGRRVRVEGNLVHGSLQRRDEPCEYRFRMEKGGAELAVRYAQCIVPDTFRDVPGMDVGVTVEGKLLSDGSFEAVQVMAKCPSKYEMKQRQAGGEQMPHAQVDLAR
jgi:cytochrome c-type biogenesis protein CcmE